MPRFEWFLCWLAWRVLNAWPDGWSWLKWPAIHMLPLWGIYGFTEGGYREFAELRTGFCSMATVEEANRDG
jgi:hypothetical protein